MVICAVCKKLGRVCSPEVCRVHRMVTQGAANHLQIDFLIDEVNADFVVRALDSLHGEPDRVLCIKSLLYEQNVRKIFMKLGSQGINDSIKTDIEQVKDERSKVKALVEKAEQELSEAEDRRDKANQEHAAAYEIYKKKLAETNTSSGDIKSSEASGHALV